MKDAYVYAVIVDGVRRYIGKGRGERTAAHMKMVRSIVRRRAAGESVRTTIFYNRLVKAWLSGACVDFEILAEGLTDQSAFEREIVEIEAARETLWNMTAGGKGGGAAGRAVSDEARARSSASNIATWSDEDLRRQHSDKMKVLWLRPEYREKQKKIQSDAAKQAIAEKARVRWANPEFRERMKRFHSSDEQRRKQGARSRQYWAARKAGG